MFAVPGEITSALSAGTNALLRLGASALTSAEDVLETFGIVAPATAAPVVSERAATVLARLRDAPAGADELVRLLVIEPAVVAAALAELELAELVEESAGVYRAAPRTT